MKVFRFSLSRLDFCETDRRSGEYARPNQFALLESGTSRGQVMPYDVQHLLKMSSDQLDELFAHSPAGDIPDSEAQGTIIIAPGTALSPELARLVKLFAWQGKHFDAQAGQLNNRVTPLGLSAVTAKVFTKARAGSIEMNVLCLITQNRRSLLIGFAMKFVFLVPTVFWGASTGIGRSSYISLWSSKIRKDDPTLNMLAERTSGGADTTNPHLPAYQFVEQPSHSWIITDHDFDRFRGLFGQRQERRAPLINVPHQ